MCAAGRRESFAVLPLPLLPDMCFHPPLSQLFRASLFAERIQLTNPAEKHLLGSFVCWLCEFTWLKETSKELLQGEALEGMAGVRDWEESA